MHSNGYSLVRKVIDVSGVDISTHTLGDGETLADALMKPTCIYVKSVHALQKQLGNADIHAMAHITGGGLTENLPRVLPDDLSAEINLATWEFPAVFNWLQQAGNITQSEMVRTFNCGVGFVIVVSDDKKDETLAFLNAQGERAWQIGQIVERTDKAVVYI